MSKLYIIYKGRTAGFELPEDPWYMTRYINMDTGKICFNMSSLGRFFPGGRPINPKSETGQLLIKIADFYIHYRDTVWHKGSAWKGTFHDKYLRFYYNPRDYQS